VAVLRGNHSGLDLSQLLADDQLLAAHPANAIAG
jgi:hypothetical protein